jgi:hypothetical protein
VLAVIGALGVAGCGGGDYPSKPDDICKEAGDKVNRLAKPKTAGDLHVYFLQSQMILVDEIRRLKEVKPPSDKQAAYQSFVSGLDRGLRVLRRATDTVASNPRRALTLLSQQGQARALRNQQAMAAGLKQCARSA